MAQKTTNRYLKSQPVKKAWFNPSWVLRCIILSFSKILYRILYYVLFLTTVIIFSCILLHSFEKCKKKKGPFLSHFLYENDNWSLCPNTITTLCIIYMIYWGVTVSINLYPNEGHFKNLFPYPWIQNFTSLTLRAISKPETV